MGKLVQNMTDSIRQAQREQVNSRYAIFLDQRPTFVNYYAQDKIKSTLDKNLGGPVEFVGGESGIKYNKLEDFPVYGMPTFSLERELNDVGQLDNEISGEVNILPGTITPKVEDIFTMPGIEHIAYARISKVTPSHLQGQTYYKVAFFFTSMSSDIEHQVVETFETDFDSIGVEGNAVFLKKSLHSLAEHFTTVTDYIKDFYKARFFNSPVGMFRLPPAYSQSVKFGDVYETYDYVVGDFLQNTQAYRRDKKYFGSIAFNFQDRGYDASMLDINSPYKAFENLAMFKSRIVDAGNYLIYSLQQPNEGDTLFYSCYGKKIYVPWRFTKTPMPNIMAGTALNKCFVQIFPDGFCEALAQDNIDLDDELIESYPTKIILRYFKGEYHNPDVTFETNIEKFIQEINNSLMFTDDLAFWLLPIIFHIATTLKQEIDSQL